MQPFGNRAVILGVFFKFIGSSSLLCIDGLLLGSINSLFAPDPLNVQGFPMSHAQQMIGQDPLGRRHLIRVIDIDDESDVIRHCLDRSVASLFVAEPLITAQHLRHLVGKMSAQLLQVHLAGLATNLCLGLHALYSQLAQRFRLDGLLATQYPHARI
jgi:hypothetical protein